MKKRDGIWSLPKRIKVQFCGVEIETKICLNSDPVVGCLWVIKKVVELLKNNRQKNKNTRKKQNQKEKIVQLGSVVVISNFHQYR